MRRDGGSISDDPLQILERKGASVRNAGHAPADRIDTVSAFHFAFPGTDHPQARYFARFGNPPGTARRRLTTVDDQTTAWQAASDLL
jgi:hypothetical protein